MDYQNKWLYKGKEFTEILPEFPNFVYLITNNTTGKRYVGKKQFTSHTTRPPLKGQKRKRKVVKASDWQTYYGSCKELQDDVVKFGVDSFTREILHLCKNKSTATYLEAKEQFSRGVLESDDYYNGWISCKIVGKFIKLG